MNTLDKVGDNVHIFLSSRKISTYPDISPPSIIALLAHAVTFPTILYTLPLILVPTSFLIVHFFILWHRSLVRMECNVSLSARRFSSHECFHLMGTRDLRLGLEVCLPLAESFSLSSSIVLNLSSRRLASNYPYCVQWCYSFIILWVSLISFVEKLYYYSFSPPLGCVNLITPLSIMVIIFSSPCLIKFIHKLGQSCAFFFSSSAAHSFVSPLPDSLCSSFESLFSRFDASTYVFTHALISFSNSASPL